MTNSKMKNVFMNKLSREFKLFQKHMKLYKFKATRNVIANDSNPRDQTCPAT